MQYLGSVIVRLIAVFFLINNLSALLSFAYFASSSDRAVLTISLSVVGVGIVVFGLLFLYPGLVLRGLKFTAGDGTDTPVSADSLVHTGTILIGVYFTAIGIQSLFRAVTFELIMRAESLSGMLSKPAFGTGLFALATGVVLMFGAHRISSFLVKMRHL